jgi:hypothetical protein
MMDGNETDATGTLHEAMTACHLKEAEFIQKYDLIERRL